MDIKLLEYAPNIHEIRHVFRDKDESLMIGAMSDVHFDSIHCNRELFKEHLDYIKEKNGIIMIHGDLFDVMGTFRDPRSKPNDLRPEYIVPGKGYLDLIVEDAYNFLRPYKKNLLLITEGNHETNITRRHDVNIIDRLCFALRNDGGVTKKGGYSGYVNILLTRAGSQAKSSLKYYYHHGKGGNAHRSKGVLYSQLDAMKNPDADIIVSGHDHNAIHDPSNVSEYLCTMSKKYTIKHKQKSWIKLGSYKRNEKTAGVGGYEVEKGYLPKTVGGYIIELSIKRTKEQQSIKRKTYHMTEAI